MIKYNTIKLNKLIPTFLFSAFLIISACKSNGSLPENEKIELGNGYIFLYEFNTKPKIGPVILKIHIKGKDNKTSTSFKVTGDSYMPSMKGSHDTGDIEFKLNKKGVYLLPVNVMMPGDWEINLKFYEGEKIIYENRIKFDV